MIKQRRKNVTEDRGGAINGSALLSLSLFVILLAFFIVLNAISTYSEVKTGEVFRSIDMAFDIAIPETDFKKSSADDRESQDKNQGDSLEDIQGVLKSILPGLNVDLSEQPNGGKTMAIMMKKDRFEKLSKQLIPVFTRILGVKDGDQDYILRISSSVRDPLSQSAMQSFQVIEKYRTMIVNQGLGRDRIILSIDKGNPAFLIFHFDSRV